MLLTWAAPLVLLAACDSVELSGPGGGGEHVPPVQLDAYYYDQAVTLSWEMGSGWEGRFFRIYGRRQGLDFTHLADVTSCSDGVCSYRDLNIEADVTYEYYVATVGARGEETPSDYAIEVYVPEPISPPAPGALEAVAMDGALFLQWDDRSRDVEDFAFYRVYLEREDDVPFLLGETDSEGFLDLLVENGSSYGYFVTAVDDRGHESGGSELVVGTPRPDFHGELLRDHDTHPGESGFRFGVSEADDPIIHGDAPDRDFRLEVDDDGWWLVPGPGVQVHEEAAFTTALRCGPAADAGCLDVARASTSGYLEPSVAVELLLEHTYVLRLPDDEGWRYASIRVTHLGATQEGGLLLFDWAHQLQAGNRELAPPAP